LKTQTIQQEITMGLFDKILGKKEQPQPQESVIVYLDGVNLPDEVYKEWDLTTLVTPLADAVEFSHVGVFDGSETGPEVTTLYMYGPDADLIFTTIEPILREYPLCKGASVVLRKGEPGSPETEILL
jgi:hypothetical protein